MKPEAQFGRSRVCRGPEWDRLSSEKPVMEGPSEKLTGTLNIEISQGSAHTPSSNLALVAVTWVEGPVSTSACNPTFSLMSFY